MRSKTQELKQEVKKSKAVAEELEKKEETRALPKAR